MVVINEESLLTQKQASRLLKVSIKTIYRLRQQGKHTTIKIGKSVKLKRSDIEWLIKQKEIDHFHQGYLTNKTNTEYTMFSLRKMEEDKGRVYGQKIAKKLKLGF